MLSRSRALALVAALLLPALVLAWLGLVAMREENERGRARHRGQGEAMAAVVARELDRRFDELLRANEDGAAAAGDVLALSFASDGAWRGVTQGGERSASDRGAPQDPVADAELARLLSDEIDRLQAAGDLEAAVVRLAGIEADAADSNIVAWALDARASLLDRLGRAGEAEAARRELVADHPGARNAGGLRRAFAARLALAEHSDDRCGELLELYADALRDYGAREETATADFVRRVRLIVAGCADAGPELAELDREDARRARARAWFAILRSGPSDWAARSAPGGRATFPMLVPPIPSANPLSIEFPGAAPGRGVFAAALAADDVATRGPESLRERGGLRGGAQELELLFARALEAARADAALTSLGFEAAIEPRAAASLGDTVALLALPAPLESWAVAVRGGDLGVIAAEERRRTWLVGGLVAGALFSAVLGAWFTLRGVAREVEAARGREEFVAAVTHELKTPLAAIRLFAEMQERGGVAPEKVREFGARTVAETDRLARLVDSVLDLARIEHGAAGTPGAPASGAPRAVVEAAEIARAALDVVEPLARERGYELRFTDAPEPLFVRADRDALVRALVNLLDNALKYGDRAQPIELELSVRDASIEFAVLDRGRGVPAEERERIFEPFRRVGSELTREAPGVGLGLALVAKIAAAHGGCAVCEAREAGGSRFVIRLPRVRDGKVERA